jgi:gamma-glutamyltranspeptidase / glutathione hydrolase
MTLSDLSSYRVTIRKPISITYRGYKIYSCGAPSGGSVALSILKIIEGYNMSDPSLAHLNVHRLDEAMRFSYAARSSLGDPDFFPYMNGLESNMLRPSTAEAIRERISDDRTHNNVSYYAGNPYSLPENHGTSHIVATDASGLSITLTSTVNLLFGSQLVVPETGVIMNNEMNDFSIPGVRNAFGFVPSPINYIRPFKRPLSSISPLIIEHANGSLYLSIGAAGGSRIPTATVQGVWHVLDHGMGLRESLEEKRLHDQLVPATTNFEFGFDGDVVRSMRGRGHNVSWVGPESAVQGVLVRGDGFEAGSEPRQRDSGGLIC